MGNDPGGEFVSLRCPQCGGGISSNEDSLICPYCGTRLIRRASRADAPGAQAGPTFSQGMRFTPYAYMDPNAYNMQAFSMLIPSGWQVIGGVQWNLNVPAAPANIAFRVHNPQGPEAFEAFPSLLFFWTNEPTMRMFYPPGSYYNGGEVRPPMGAQQMMREIVLPRARPVPGLQILAEEHLPGLLQQLQANAPYGAQVPQGQMTSDGAKMRIRYSRDGADVEEEFYGVVEWLRYGMPSMSIGMAEMNFWSIEYVFSFTARAGQLDSQRDLFQTLLASFKLDQRWYGYTRQVSNGLVNNNIQQSNRALQLSRYISNNQNQINDTIMQGYYQRQQVMDHIHENFSQAIRGVENYYDPHLGGPVELPNGYNNAWTNALGEYIVSNDAGFDPNIGSSQTWTHMNKQR